MSQIMVDTNLCKRDGVCVAVCPSRILSLDKERFPEEVPGGQLHSLRPLRCRVCLQCSIS
jgi:ferredoxin